MLEKFLNRKQLAKHFGVNESTINNWLKRGCPYIQLASNRKLYDAAEVEKWLLGGK